MILLTLSRGKGEETVRLQLPASPAEIGEAFASLDRISLDTTATAILDVSSNVPVLYRCLYDVDVEDSEQFQKLQKLAERTEALSPAKAAIFSGALDAECVWNLEGALTVADRLDEYRRIFSMANLEAIVSKKTENDTQWKARQQADRENLMALQDAGVLEITSSAEAYTRYLELQGDNPAYSAGNIALAMVQDANVTVFGTKEKWKMLGRSVPVSENGNGIHIFARSTFGKGYTLADAYDVRQTQGRPLKEVHLQNDTRDMESAMTTLLNYAVCQVVIDKDLDTPAVYDPQRMELAINPDYPDHEMFAAIATAVAHSRLHGKGYNAQYDYAESDLDAQSVSYLLCRRFGVERDLPDTAELPALYDGWDAQERRQALDQIQKMSKQIGASVEKSITPQRSRVPMQHNGR